VKLNTEALNVLFVDDQKLFRDIFITFIKKTIHIKNHYEASNGLEALEILHKHSVDLVFLDIEMPLMSGDQCMRAINVQFKDVKVIVVSVVILLHGIKKMLEAGARAYVSKNAGAEDIITAIDAVMHGRKFFDSTITEIFFEEGISPEMLEVNEAAIKLSPREIEIVSLIAKGKHSKEISTDLGTCTGTVNRQRKTILEKIKGRGIADVIRYALRNGLIGIKEYLQNEKAD
jgi:two-component system response regulator NreC